MTRLSLLRPPVEAEISVLVGFSSSFSLSISNDSHDGEDDSGEEFHYCSNFLRELRVDPMGLSIYEEFSRVGGKSISSHASAIFLDGEMTLSISYHRKHSTHYLRTPNTLTAFSPER